jgi:hypothetical protein
MNIQDLANLLNEYQKHSPETDAQTQIKSQLIAYLSSSYWWRSQYISNLFPETISN